MRKIAIFCDRDGTIVQNREDYIKSTSEVEFLPNSFAALEKLAKLNAYVFIISNQSVVGRGIISGDGAETINLHIIDEIEKNGGRIDRSYTCIHSPDDNCLCRKPKPWLFLEALRDGYRFERAVVIGDQYTDILSAETLQLPSMLVKTGLGEETIKSKPFLKKLAVDDLLVAAEEIEQWLNASTELEHAEVQSV